MSKREKFMLFLWFGGPKTAEEIAEHMQMPWGGERKKKTAMKCIG